MKKNSLTTPAPGAGLNHKLRGYSATAGAALLLAPAATAQTINIVDFSSNGGSFSSSAPTLLAGDNFKAAGPSHVHVFSGRISGFVTSSFGRLSVGANAGKVMANGFNVLDRLGTHAVIANPAHLDNRGLAASRSTRGTQGRFVPAAAAGAHNSGYMGFKTNAGDYGWLRIVVTNNGFGFPTSITFAPSQILVGGQHIYGQIGLSSLTTPSAIPEPASVASGLALFALGAAGVREHRRRKKLAA